jgi:adenine-specific DNA methylase
MIPKECKRLAEVDFPIAVVSRHSAREKSIRHGHPSTLHLWWARRPLAACRAMLMALLLPDPCDEHCPEEFKAAARRALLGLPARPGRWDGEVRSDEGLRKVLLEFIGDFANWDNAANAGYLACGRGLVKAAHPDETPLVVDPFAGGGSIPLEALRLGCDAFASDLNPVACLILKVLLEDIPRHGPELADELRRVGAEIKAAAEKELAEFYPPDPDGARPIAYLWARTVRCEAPNCGAEIPLARSFWLCKKASRKRALRYEVVRPQRGAPHVEFEIFEPRRESEVPSGTVSRAKATCPCCGIVLPPERVRAQLSEQRGGADVIFDQKGRRAGGARMLAVVTLRPGDPGRHYRLPTERDYRAVSNAQQRLTRILNDWERNRRHGLCPAPNEPLPPRNTNSFRLPNYGVRTWSELFNNRQRAALVTCCGAVRAHTLNRNAGLSEALADAIALVASRCADASSAHSAWRTGVECNRSTFARQALSMVWDFCESVTTTDAAGGYDGALGWVAEVIEAQGRVVQTVGQVAVTDATEPRLPDATGAVWFTDPPYYDAVGYAELSDYFYVWLRRCGENSRLRDPFDPENPLVPKTRECVQDERYRDVSGVPKDRKFFERTMASAFSAGRRVARADGVGCVVFAHKTTEGWEALLSGMIRGGWTITGSWPIATERPGRLRSQESAALATSIHLICRPRPDDAPVGDWGDVLRELPRRVEAWMDRLQDEGVRGADLVFACIGPALEIFSRYSKVETAEGREVPLDEYLLKVWEVVGRTALNQVLGTAEGRARNGAAGALEEDARLTALFLWTLQATTEESPTNGNGNGAANGDSEDADEPDEDEEEAGSSGRKKKGFSLIFDVARRFAQPLGIHLEAWEKRIIETEKGVVRLIPVLERTNQLFGEEGAGAIADRLERSPATAAAAQMMLFPEPAAPPKVRGRGRRKKGSVADSELETRQEATTLDRVHAAMLLQASGRANALRALLKAEVERGPDFLRLANALSALYPQGSDEKRLLDAMLLAVPR